MKYFEVVRHWVRNEFGLGFDKVVLSQRTWNRLKPAHRKIMQDLFFEMEATKWYPVLKQRLDAVFRKWEEIMGAGTVVTRRPSCASSLRRPPSAWPTRSSAAGT
jgi:TRAP-type C4-dicarboxylate transport system substrate-binding protein